MGRRMGRYAPLLVRVSAVSVLSGSFNDDFLGARPCVHEVMDGVALFMAHEWDAAWDDLFHCWCGCPL